MIRNALTALLLTAALLGGYAAHTPHTVTKPVTVVHTTDDVTSFNDGFMTALHGDAK